MIIEKYISLLILAFCWAGVLNILIGAYMAYKNSKNHFQTKLDIETFKRKLFLIICTIFLCSFLKIYLEIPPYLSSGIGVVLIKFLDPSSNKEKGSFLKLIPTAFLISSCSALVSLVFSFINDILESFYQSTAKENLELSRPELMQNKGEKYNNERYTMAVSPTGGGDNNSIVPLEKGTTTPQKSPRSYNYHNDITPGVMKDGHAKTPLDNKYPMEHELPDGINLLDTFDLEDKAQSELKAKGASEVKVVEPVTTEALQKKTTEVTENYFRFQEVKDQVILDNEKLFGEKQPCYFKDSGEDYHRRVRNIDFESIKKNLKKTDILNDPGETYYSIDYEKLSEKDYLYLKDCIGRIARLREEKKIAEELKASYLDVVEAHNTTCKKMQHFTPSEETLQTLNSQVEFPKFVNIIIENEPDLDDIKAYYYHLRHPTS